MDVIDTFFLRRQQESQKYKFGIVEVVHIPFCRNASLYRDHAVRVIRTNVRFGYGLP